MRSRALAVALVVAAVAAGCGSNAGGEGGGTGQAATGATTPGEASGTTVTVVTTVATTATVPAEPPASFTAFQTPSKNIGCGYFGRSLRCDILSGLRPEPTGTCALDWVGFTLERTGPAAPQCAGDTVYDSASPILAYGETWRRGGITCLSRKTGLRCTNQDGDGFLLSRARSQAF